LSPECDIYDGALDSLKKESLFLTAVIFGMTLGNSNQKLFGPIFFEIDYCDVVLDNLLASTIQPLQRVLNAVAQLIKDLGP